MTQIIKMNADFFVIICENPINPEILHLVFFVITDY